MNKYCILHRKTITSYIFKLITLFHRAYLDETLSRVKWGSVKGWAVRNFSLKDCKVKGYRRV